MHPLKKLQKALEIGEETVGVKVVMIILVIKDLNEDEIIDFVQWTQKTNLHVRFIEFMPFDGNNWNWDKKVSFKEILDTILFLCMCRQLLDSSMSSNLKDF